jgi:hypothetical protein
MGYYLAVDHSIDCSSTRYKAALAAALVMVLVYPIGVPLIYSVLLWRDRHDLMDPAIMVASRQHGTETETETETHGVHPRWSLARRKQFVSMLTFFFSDATRGKRPDHDLHAYDPLADAKWAKISANHRLSFLIGPYERRTYWFEVVECFRRISLSGLLVVFGAGSTRQVIVATFLALFFIRVGAFYNAQRANEDDTLAETCNWQLFLILYVCLLIRVGAAPYYVGSLLLFILVGSFAGILVIMLMFGLKRIRSSFKTYWGEKYAPKQGSEITVNALRKNSGDEDEGGGGGGEEKRRVEMSGDDGVRTRMEP